MVHTCSAYGCLNRFKKGSGLGFFRFPKLRSRRLQWTLALRRRDFTPSSFVRICGEHFFTGKPSSDPNHPDYVPSIFSFNKSHRRKKGRFRKKLLCDDEVLPIETSVKAVSGCRNKELSGEESGDDDSSIYGSVLNKQELEFLPLIEKNSPLVNVETVKRIIKQSCDINSSYDDSLNLLKHPQLFTFVDTKGQIIARFAQKYKIRNVPIPPPISNLLPVDTVQVIIDKKRAVTAAVDRRALCPAKNSKECKCKGIRNKYDSNDSTDRSYHPVKIKIESDFQENMDNNLNMSSDMNALVP